MNDEPRAKGPPKLTDAERHARFVETARQVGVDESPEAFDRAFDRLKVTASASARKARPPSKI